METICMKFQVLFYSKFKKNIKFVVWQIYPESGKS